MAADELKEVFADQVRKYARRRKFSINRLADFAGISRGYLSDILRSKKSASLKTIDALAEALEVEPWKLLKPGA